MMTGAREEATVSRTLYPCQSQLPLSPRSPLPSISAQGIISKVKPVASSRTSGIINKVTETTRTQLAISKGHGTTAAHQGINSMVRILRIRGKGCSTDLDPKPWRRWALGRGQAHQQTLEGDQSPATAGGGTGPTDPAHSWSAAWKAGPI